MSRRNLPYAKSCLIAVLSLTLPVAPVLRLGAAPAPASPSPAATPAVAAPSPAATPEAPPNYDGVQQGKYIATAQNAFVAQRQAKFQAFIDARTAFENAGGISIKGLTDKAAVTARRDLLAKLRTANDDYLAFMTTQEDTLRTELAKTPLVKADIDAVVTEFATKANIPRAIQLQQDEQNLLTCSDDILGDLEKWDWSLTGSNKLMFKKKSDQAAYVALEKKYNGIVKDYQSLQPQGTPTPAPSPGATAAATPAASATP
jgi:hypothetical protein